MRILTIFTIQIVVSFTLTAQLSSFNDEFNSPCNLSDWSNITAHEGWTTPVGSPAEHLEEHNISTFVQGQLYMMPYTSSWFGNWRGVLLFKEVSGNFVFTTRITALNRAGQPTPPSSSFSLAGLMIRTPTGLFNPQGGWPTGIQNYIFSSIGNARDNGQYQLEIKTTINSQSVLERPNIGMNAEIFMRVVRIDSAIIVLSSFDNQSWEVRNRYERTDFPDTLQLGFVTYTDWNNVQAVGFTNQNINILNDAYNTANGTNYNWNPDLIGLFDFARFEEVDLPPELEGEDLINIDTTGGTFDFLMYPSTPKIPEGYAIWNGSQDGDVNNVLNWVDVVTPGSNQGIVIPNCLCPEMNAVAISSGTHTYGGLHLENGASLSIAAGATLNIDLSANDAILLNEGNIINEGTLIVQNADGKSITIVENLTNQPGAVFRIEE